MRDIATIKSGPKDKEFWEILKLRIWDILDFDSSGYSDLFLKRRIETRMRHLKLDSFKDYSELIIHDRSEAETLLRSLTVHVTHFFRDRSMYKFLSDDVIPQMIKSKKTYVKKPIIRIWSAGCSTGEETISVLISVLEALKDEIDDYFISIIGTDIDNKVIRRAKEGIYETTQFQETEEFLLEKYFEKHDDSHFRLKAKYQKYIKYEVGDITKRILNNIDLLLCRNTVIYFQIKTKTDLYERFYDFLNPGGFFIMGKTEVLIGPAKNRFEVYDYKERVFRKNDG